MEVRCELVQIIISETRDSQTIVLKEADGPRAFPILIEEIYQARKYTDRFSEIPFVLTCREIGSSKFNYTPKVLWDYLKYALKSLMP